MTEEQFARWEDVDALLAKLRDRPASLEEACVYIVKPGKTTMGAVLEIRAARRIAKRRAVSSGR